MMVVVVENLDQFLVEKSTMSSHHEGSSRRSPKTQHYHSIRCCHRSRRRKEALSQPHIFSRILELLFWSDADVAIEEASDYFVTETKEEDEEVGGGKGGATLATQDKGGPMREACVSG
ncbi:hypothetical protein AHAS_Ahas17G0182600 [Arachis hypogaea]